MHGLMAEPKMIEDVAHCRHAEFGFGESKQIGVRLEHGSVSPKVTKILLTSPRKREVREENTRHFALVAALAHRATKPKILCKLPRIFLRGLRGREKKLEIFLD